jgi:hypothetical protein
VLQKSSPAFQSGHAGGVAPLQQVATNPTLASEAFFINKFASLKKAFALNLFIKKLNLPTADYFIQQYFYFKENSD